MLPQALYAPRLVRLGKFANGPPAETEKPFAAPILFRSPIAVPTRYADWTGGGAKGRGRLSAKHWMSEAQAAKEQGRLPGAGALSMVRRIATPLEEPRSQVDNRRHAFGDSLVAGRA